MWLCGCRTLVEQGFINVHCVPSDFESLKVMLVQFFDDDVQDPDESQEPQPVQETPADVPEAEPSEVPSHIKMSHQ